MKSSNTHLYNFLEEYEDGVSGNQFLNVKCAYKCKSRREIDEMGTSRKPKCMSI